MSQHGKIFIWSVIAAMSATAQAQPAPNVFNVLSWSSVFNQTVYNEQGKPIGVLNQAVPNVYSETSLSFPAILNAIGGGADPHNLSSANFQADSTITRVNSAINSSIATALGVIPLASPASGVIFQTDPATGVDLPATSTLGPVFTERAETIGKHKLYVGVTHEDLHFTSLNGQSLNGLQLLSANVASGVTNGSSNLVSYPATFDVGMDVRLSQDVALLTYGVTDRFDVSVGLPMVHAAVAAKTYNGILYDGNGLLGQAGPTSTNPNCWCAGTFNPKYLVNAATNFTEPVIGQSSLAKTGFGDLLLRFKGTVLNTRRASIAAGADVRFATGDAQNYLGSGTNSFKPFVAMSLYTAPTHGIVFAPHLNVGWQFSGMSVLGGQLQPNTGLTATMTDGSGTVKYVGAPLTSTKDYLPDVFSWALGTEVAFGRRNTLIVDVLGNQIGWIHGARI